MDNRKDDAYYVDKILTDLHFIRKHMCDTSVEELSENEILLDSMLFRLIQIQENTKNLTETYRMACPDIPWRDIAGLRNRIVHDYGHVDLSVIYDTLTVDIPQLIDLFMRNK